MFLFKFSSPLEFEVFFWTANDVLGVIGAQTFPLSFYIFFLHFVDLSGVFVSDIYLFLIYRY